MEAAVAALARVGLHVDEDSFDVATLESILETLNERIATARKDMLSASLQVSGAGEGWGGEEVSGSEIAALREQVRAAAGALGPVCAVSQSGEDVSRVGVSVAAAKGAQWAVESLAAIQRCVEVVEGERELGRAARLVRRAGRGVELLRIEGEKGGKGEKSVLKALDRMVAGARARVARQLTARLEEQVIVVEGEEAATLLAERGLSVDGVAGVLEIRRGGDGGGPSSTLSALRDLGGGCLEAALSVLLVKLLSFLSPFSNPAHVASISRPSSDVLTITSLQPSSSHTSSPSIGLAECVVTVVEGLVEDGESDRRRWREMRVGTEGWERDVDRAWGLEVGGERSGGGGGGGEEREEEVVSALEAALIPPEGVWTEVEPFQRVETGIVGRALWFGLGKRGVEEDGLVEIAEAAVPRIPWIRVPKASLSAPQTYSTSTPTRSASLAQLLVDAVVRELKNGNKPLAYSLATHAAATEEAVMKSGIVRKDKHRSSRGGGEGDEGGKGEGEEEEEEEGGEEEEVLQELVEDFAGQAAAARRDAALEEVRDACVSHFATPRITVNDSFITLGGKESGEGDKMVKEGEEEEEEGEGKGVDDGWEVAMKKDDGKGEEESGLDLPGSWVAKLPTMQVSVAAATVVRVAASVASEAGTEVDEAARGVLWTTARDCLDVYRAVVPHLHRSSLASSIEANLTLHNDALLLTHAATYLPVYARRAAGEKGDGDDKEARDAVTVAALDLVPPLRTIAQEALVLAVRLSLAACVEASGGIRDAAVRACGDATLFPTPSRTPPSSTSPIPPVDLSCAWIAGLNPPSQLNSGRKGRDGESGGGGGEARGDGEVERVDEDGEWVRAGAGVAAAITRAALAEAAAVRKAHEVSQHILPANAAASVPKFIASTVLDHWVEGIVHLAETRARNDRAVSRAFEVFGEDESMRAEAEEALAAASGLSTEAAMVLADALGVVLGATSAATQKSKQRATWTRRILLAATAEPPPHITPSSSTPTPRPLTRALASDADQDMDEWLGAGAAPIAAALRHGSLTDALQPSTVATLANALFAPSADKEAIRKSSQSSVQAVVASIFG